MALAALANAFAHPVLAGRAKELEAPELLRALPGVGPKLGARLAIVAETALLRLDGPEGGDVERGVGGRSGKNLDFYRFKWGYRRSLIRAWGPKLPVRVLLRRVLIAFFLVVVPIRFIVWNQERLRFARSARNLPRRPWKLAGGKRMGRVVNDV